MSDGVQEGLSSWSWEAEFETLDFGDKRLNRRWVSVVEKMSERPECSINEALSDWASVKAAYRLFENPRVESQKILDAHRHTTMKRIELTKETVIAIQDTTFLNYTTHYSLDGIGPIRNKNDSSKGFVMHSVLAVNESGAVLGLLDQQCWAREEVKGVKSHHRSHLPVDQKESFRWLEGLRHLQGHQKVVMVADREADMYELFQAADELEISFVVRVSRDRLLLEGGSLNDELTKQASVGQIEVEVPGRVHRALLEIRLGVLKLKPTSRSKQTKMFPLEPLSLWVIEAKESQPPRGLEPLHWQLLTNVPTKDFDEAKVRISWYRKRWNVEEFHKILKSGIQVEKCRLGTFDKLKRYLSLASILACRLHWMTKIARANPQISCNIALSEPEWKSLCILHTRKKNPPDKPPSLGEALLWIAQLGGYLLHQKKPPGVITTWRGWKRLEESVTMYEVLTS